VINGFSILKFLLLKIRLFKSSSETFLFKKRNSSFVKRKSCNLFFCFVFFECLYYILVVIISGCKNIKL
jgi:hypothetical protein